ncbi:MAG TPA: SH3 domain-containing protein [Devosia sp.]|nr:SH3 domain-containing protein [Devosia sp.]
MALSKKLMAAGLAGLAIMATTATAFAAPAFATGNVNVRSGPGTGYNRVDTLRRGEHVDVQQCRGSWCYVEKRGPDGWVSANYLSRGGHHGGGWRDDDHWDRPHWNPRPQRPHWNPRPQRPPHWNPRPQPQPWPHYPGNSDASVCFNGPNGYFCIGS